MMPPTLDDMLVHTERTSRAPEPQKNLRARPPLPRKHLTSVSVRLRAHHQVGRAEGCHPHLGTQVHGTSSPESLAAWTPDSRPPAVVHTRHL